MPHDHPKAKGDDPWRDVSKRKSVFFQIVAATTSSTVDLFVTMPLDVIKTRLQLQSLQKAGNRSQLYAGVVDAFPKIYRHEGLTAFWRGIGPILVSDTPKRSIKFLIFEQSKPLFMFGSPHPTPITYALAGGMGGTLEVLLQNPFEVIKIVQQASHKRLHSVRVAQDIIKKDGFGLRGLYKGLTATMVRNCIFHVMFFGFFFTVKEGTPVCNDTVKEFMRKFAIAFTAGSLGCTLSIPFDMAKTRIQGPQPVPGEIKYDWTWQTLSTVYKEEGFLAFYRGLTAQVMRVGPGGAILILGYEFMTRMLLKNFS